MVKYRDVVYDIKHELLQYITWGTGVFDGHTNGGHNYEKLSKQQNLVQDKY